MTVPSLVLDTACKDLDNWPRTTPRLLLRVVVVKDRERDVAKKSDGLILVLGVGGTKAANTSDCGFRHKHGHQQPPNTKSLPSYYYHFPAITNHQPRFEIPNGSPKSRFDRSNCSTTRAHQRNLLCKPKLLPTATARHRTTFYNTNEEQKSPDPLLSFFLYLQHHVLRRNHHC